MDSRWPKKESPVPGTLSVRRAIYRYDRSRRGEASQAGEQEGEVGGEERGMKEKENEKVGRVQAERWKPKERGQMDRRLKKKGGGDFRAVAAALRGRPRAAARHAAQMSDTGHQTGAFNSAAACKPQRGEDPLTLP